MTTLELIPDVTGHQLAVLAIILAVVIAIAVCMGIADHVATEWAAARYEAGQSPTEGRITAEPPTRTRIPEQRRPDHDQDGDQA
jgi:hypothetical protein